MSLNSPPVRTHTAKPGTCPHGLPLGACPICSGMAGGNSTSKRDIPRNVGEMSYNQCAAIGAMLRAQKNARASAKQAQENHIQALVEFQKNMASTHQRLTEFAVFLSSKMPKIIAVPTNFILVNIVGNTLKFIQNFPTVMANFTQNIRQKFADISDKLAAIYGEMEAAIKDNLSKFVSKLKKKLKFSFLIFGTQETDDEEQKIEESKRIFELKTYIHKLFTNIKQKTEKDNEKDEHKSVE